MADLAALLAEVKGALQRMEKAREDYETGAHLTKTQQDEIDLWRQLRAAEDAIKHASPEWLGALVQAVEDQQRQGERDMVEIATLRRELDAEQDTVAQLRGAIRDHIRACDDVRLAVEAHDALRAILKELV